MIKAITILLFFFFLADSVGCILFLLFDGHEIRKEMQALLGSGDLKENRITFNLDHKEFSKLTWIEHDKEFFYNGKLYDASSVKHSGKHIHITCFEDRREAEFYQRIQKVMDLDQPVSKDHHSFILTFFKFLSQLLVHTVSDIITHPQISDHPVIAYIHHYHFAYHAIHFRPPDPVSFSN